jgi:RNA polymerase sigma-70 factor (ECF subfamily)
MSLPENNNNNTLEEDLIAVNRVLAGDKSAFEILQKRYKRIISSLIRRMVRNEDDVDDLIQETFIKAYNALSTFQSGYSFSAWLYRIASNTCIDFLRKRRFDTISINNPMPSSDEEQTLDIHDSTYLPDVNLLNEERKKALNEAIANLPENYRKIIKLRHEEELDYNQIADILGIPLGTVKAHLFRARKILLTKLKKNKHLFMD